MKYFTRILLHASIFKNKNYGKAAVVPILVGKKYAIGIAQFSSTLL